MIQTNESDLSEEEIKDFSPINKLSLLTGHICDGDRHKFCDLHENLEIKTIKIPDHNCFLITFGKKDQNQLNELTTKTRKSFGVLPNGKLDENLGSPLTVEINLKTSTKFFFHQRKMSSRFILAEMLQ